MWINEAETPELEHDYVMVIEEILRQRIQGVKNKNGKWTTPAFPKLHYVLTENNYKEGTKYFELTKLAATNSTLFLIAHNMSALSFAFRYGPVSLIPGILILFLLDKTLLIHFLYH